MGANYIKLTWTNTCDLGGVLYNSTSLVNQMFLDTDVIKPEYFSDETGFVNGNDVFVKTEQKLKKRYGFSIIAPEYVADALTFMALHDTINIIYINGLFSSAIRNVQVAVNWENFLNDCMATIFVTFEQDDQIVNTSCCNNLV